MMEVHAETAARGDGSRSRTGDGLHANAPGHDQARREAGPKDRQTEVEEPGAESASPRCNGTALRLDGCAASEQQPDEALAAVTPAVRGIKTLAVLAVAFVAAIASYDH